MNRRDALVVTGSALGAATGRAQTADPGVATGRAQLPPRGTPLRAADPSILVHDGRYYLYGTDDADTAAGLPVFVSDDLVHWQPQGLALKRGDAYGQRDFWNGGVVRLPDGRFLLHYTAEEHIAFAFADSPLGPFRSSHREPLHAAFKEIDTELWLDEAGQAWFYFVRFDRGNVLHGARLLIDNGDRPRLDEGSVRELLRASAGWEHTDTRSNWPVLEAPCMVRHGGRCHLVYTANDFRNPDYAVGIASGEHPLGPFKRHARNPLLQRPPGLQGTGSAQLFRDLQGRWQLLCHAHASPTAWSPRKPVIAEVAWTADHFLELKSAPRVL